MKLLVYSIRDRAMNAFMRPMFVPSEGLAVRVFVDEVNRQDANNSMYAHPDDFDLWQLGEFDDESGKLVSLADGPRQVSIGKSVAVRDTRAEAEYASALNAAQRFAAKGGLPS